MKNTSLKKSLCLVFLGLGLTALLHARGNRDSSDLTIYGLMGSSGVGIIRLFEDPPEIEGFNVRVEALANQELMAARFISGEARVGILPPNMAAKLASQGIDIRVLAVIGTGMLSLLTNDPAIQSITDLRGRTVEVAGQGATPDFVFRTILRNHGMEAEGDLNLAYALAPPEIAQSLIAGRIPTGLLPEPFATMARMGNSDLRSISNIQDEWIRAGGGSSFPMTLLVADGAFASANPAGVDIILEAVRNSIEWVISHPDEAGLMVEKHELGLRAPIVRAAIPNSSYVFIPAREARPSLEALFRVLDRKSVV